MPTPDEWNRLVNSKWPNDVPKPSAQEAISGAKRLYRKIMGRPWRGKWKITSGNRNTWPRNGTFYVNPDHGWNGFDGIIHLMAHYLHRKRYPGKRPHHYTELELEKELTNYAIAHGFHEGRLKAKARPSKPKPDRRTTKLQSATEAMKRWEAKRKRAETAVKKYRKKVRYYEKLPIVFTL